jgi:hypothetical protein
VHPVHLPQRGPVRIGVALLGEHARTIALVNPLLEQVGHREPLLGRVAEHVLDLGADVQGLGARVVSRVDVGDEGELLNEGAVAELGGAQLLFGGGSVADITYARREQRRPGDVDAADGQLRREARAVGAHRLDLDASSEKAAGPRAGAGLAPAGERTPMGLASGRRNQKGCELAPEHPLARIPEGLLRSAVELEDVAAVVDRYHRVEGSIEDRGGVRLTGARHRRRVEPSTAVADHRLLTIVAIRARADPRSG